MFELFSQCDFNKHFNNTVIRTVHLKQTKSGLDWLWFMSIDEYKAYTQMFILQPIGILNLIFNIYNFPLKYTIVSSCL